MQPSEKNDPNQYQKEMRKTRNRIRLFLLFSIYPIYKTWDYYTDGNQAMAIVMGIFSLIYISVLIYFLSKQ